MLAAEGRHADRLRAASRARRRGGALAARAAYLAGFAGTATAIRRPRFGIPVFGTMAHSFVQAHDNETQAFIDFAESFPGNATLLIDTYDTGRGGPQGRRARASARGSAASASAACGSTAATSTRCRARCVAILDAAGLRDCAIFASGNLDEHRVRALVDAGAPIASFGVGTSLTTSSDAPCLDAVYKLQEYDGIAAPQALGRQGDVAWPQAGLAALERRPDIRRRQRAAGRRARRRHAAARLRDARRPTRSTFARALPSVRSLPLSARGTADTPEVARPAVAPLPRLDLARRAHARRRGRPSAASRCIRPGFRQVIGVRPRFVPDICRGCAKYGV